MEDSLTALMPDTVTIYSTAAPSADGADGFASTGVSYSARVTFDPATIMRAAGPVSDVSAVVWIDSTVAISRGATCALPGGSRPPIKQVIRVDDEAGLHHVKLLLGG